MGNLIPRLLHRLRDFNFQHNHNKPHKAVHHIRQASSRIFSPKKESHTIEIHDPEKQDLELQEREREAEEFFQSKGMSFATIGEMNGRRKTFANEQVMSYDRADT